MLHIIISIILLIAYTILIGVYVFGWLRQSVFLKRDIQPKTFVSILVPARNEADNILALLQSIDEGNYPKDLYEIIVIDDHSEDETAVITTSFLKNINGHLINLKEHIDKEQHENSYKKRALAIAISQAKGSLIVTTDADCTVSKNWLNDIVDLYEMKDAKFIAAPVSFINTHHINSVLYHFQSLDFMMMQGITAAANTLRLGSMCNGANLAFDKDAFYKVNGYEGINDIASGDDMLLMAKIAKHFPNEVVYLKSKDAIVQTLPQPTWGSFLNQRIRWSSKNDKYSEKRLFWILLIIYLFNLSLLILAIGSFINILYLYLLCIFLVVKIIMELFLMIPVARFYNKQKELIWFPILQPLHVVYIILAGFLGKFGKYRWKERIVK